MGDGWQQRVAFSDPVGGFAYNPRQVIVDDQSAQGLRERFGLPDDAVQALFPAEDRDSKRDDGGSWPVVPLSRVSLPEDVALAVVALVRASGGVAQPDHVFFAHGHGCGCCGPHPSVAMCLPALAGSPLYGSPLYGSPLYGSPLYGSPLYGSPLYGSPVYASPVYASTMGAPAVLVQHYRLTGERRSSARPAPAPDQLWWTGKGPAPAEGDGSIALAGSIRILDSGAAAGDHRPAALHLVPLPPSDHHEVPDCDGDETLDPAAGHGTFIASLVNRLAPDLPITVRRCLTNQGDGCEALIVEQINQARLDGVRYLNLSFGGYVLDQPYALAQAVRLFQEAGGVVVASAGNDGVCQPTYPAALPGVVSVGALGPHGPAPFTNYGPWVRACAPGVDLRSGFFTDFNGVEQAVLGGSDPDHFQGWALWSGTSFAAPIVLAAIARHAAQAGTSPQEAAAQLIDAPELYRIPNLGTVINTI